MVNPPRDLAQPVITQLGEDAAQRFLLQVALFAGPGCVLVGAADRGVDAQVPRDRTLRLGQGLEPVPGAVPLPPTEEVVSTTASRGSQRRHRPRDRERTPDPHPREHLHQAVTLPAQRDEPAHQNNLDVDEDLPKGMPEGVREFSQFLVGEPGSVRIQDLDPESGEPHRPVIDQAVERRLDAAAGDRRHERPEAIVVALRDCLAPPA